VTVAGHPAAAYAARVSIAGIAEPYIQTVIVAPEWGRLYIVTGAFPEATWPNHTEDLDWMLEGFQIEAAPPPTPGVSGIPTWMFAAIAVGVAVVGAAAAVVWRRKRKRGPPAAPLVQQPAAPEPLGQQDRPPP
jgi:hypothetical protein